MRGAPAGLSERQLELVDAWFPEAEVVADHSWGLISTRVLELVTPGGRVIVKASGPSDHHLGRELRAHREWLAPWTAIGRAPRLLHADEEARILATAYLPGVLVQGSAAEEEPETFRQAGRLLALLHAQPGAVDPDHGRTLREQAIALLDRPHRIDPRTAARAREVVASWPDGPAALAPTHGDWQPRNWLVHGGGVSVIDLGRADLRPVATDLLRLASRHFARDRSLEAAFVEGYGSDPREPGSWQREQIREAIATAVWAFAVGDEPFEREGLRVLDEALAEP